MESVWLFGEYSILLLSLSTIVGGLILVFMLWKHQQNSCSRNVKQSLCNSPDCVRCQQRSDDQTVITTLKKRCIQFIAQQQPTIKNPGDILEKKYPRVLEAISSLSNKANILVSVYKSSGCEISDEMQYHNPHIWTVPNLSRLSFWNPNTISELQNISKFAFKKVMEDFQRVNSIEFGWKQNSTASGRWRIYPLFNQGRKIDENCLNCFETVKIVTSIQSFMHDCVFGNMLFSVLDPNSSIEPHTGPCNFRLRCHLPLIVPSGYKIQVATDTQEWKTGELMVFDDSLVHRVWSEEGKSGEESRVVFIFDIWHPELRPHEIDLLRHCYSGPFS